MILLERGSRGLAPSQMSAAGEIFQDLRYATLDPTLDQVQPFQNWPWTTLALHRMGDLGPRWATLDRPWTAWSKVGPMPKSQHCFHSRIAWLLRGRYSNLNTRIALNAWVLYLASVPRRRAENSAFHLPAHHVTSPDTSRGETQHARLKSVQSQNAPSLFSCAKSLRKRISRI